MQARSLYIDTTKGYLIFLVVWGHLIEPAAFNGNISKIIYTAIYLFHMPAFAMISGMVSPNDTISIAWVKNSRRLILPLVVFQILYWPFLLYFAPGKLGGLITPSWVLWFLLSLFCWKLLLPVFLKFRWPLLISVLVAFFVGWIDDVGRAFGISRTFVFFPIFLFGYLYAEKCIQIARRHKVLGLAVLGSLFIANALLVLNSDSPIYLYGSTSYSGLQSTPITPLFQRAFTISAGIAASICIISIIPQYNSVFTRIGRKSMSIYLLHGFFVVIWWWVVSAVYPQLGIETSMTAAVLAAILCVYLLKTEAFLNDSLDWLAAKIGRLKRLLKLNYERLHS